MFIVEQTINSISELDSNYFIIMWELTPNDTAAIFAIRGA